MIGLDHIIKKRGYIFRSYKEVRKPFAVLDEIMRQLIFYDIISIIEALIRQGRNRIANTSI